MTENDAPAPHPVVDVAASHLRHDEGAYTLDEEGRAAVTNALAALAKSPELVSAVHELVAFALFLETAHASPAAAGAIVDVAAGFADDLLALGVDLDSILAHTEGRGEAFRSFRGERGTVLPASDAPLPDTAVKAASLVPRIPMGRGPATRKGGRGQRRKDD